MQEVAIIEDYRRAMLLFFRWRYNAALAKKIALTFGVACATGLLAQVRVPLPWTPVPITGQTFAALLAGVILGRWWGGISLCLYVIMGAGGVPWFTGWGGGYSHLAGPTGGYIVGFVFAALFLGHFVDKYVRARSFLSLLVLMLFANFVLIHVPGLLQLSLWFRLVKGVSPGFWQLLLTGTVPFIVGDIIKVVAAAGLACAILPKERF